ncbi:hypothetical protein EV421DRAFT_1805249 [Armillaria borealis]|uniref:Uncharacterized protein n=1 Tax=Armillaria borealis TaxID=47425 RepID=A0AA39JI41_9AGAR|nr:hypothetical protein EV421DRAFT_1805249 [Armillaria borealis]
MWSLFSGKSPWVYRAFHEHGGIPALYDKFRAKALPQTSSRGSRPVQAIKLADFYAVGGSRPVQASKLADLYAVGLLELRRSDEGALQIDALYSLVRLLAYGHHEHTLRSLEKRYGTLDIWRDEFRRELAFLDRVVVLHVLQGYEVKLPKYDHVVYMQGWPEELNRWGLKFIPSSSLDELEQDAFFGLGPYNAMEYSQVCASRLCILILC